MVLCFMCFLQLHFPKRKMNNPVWGLSEIILCCQYLLFLWYRVVNGMKYIKVDTSNKIDKNIFVKSGTNNAFFEHNRNVDAVLNSS